MEELIKYPEEEHDYIIKGGIMMYDYQKKCGKKQKTVEELDLVFPGSHMPKQAEAPETSQQGRDFSGLKSDVMSLLTAEDLAPDAELTSLVGEVAE